MVESDPNNNQQPAESPRLKTDEEEQDSGDDIMFVDSDDEWYPQAHRGEYV